jgi:PAS domain S-box-containing protein
LQRYIDELRLLQAIRLSVVATDTEGRITFANDAAESVYAGGPGDLLGRHLLDFLADADQGDEGHRALDAVLAGATWRGDLRVRRLDGTHMVVAMSATPIHDREGVQVGAVVVSEDMTEAREAEALRAEADQRLRLAHEAARLGTWQWHMAQGDVVWDTRLEEIFGFEPGGYDGTFATWASLLHHEDAEEMLAIVDRAVAERAPYILRTRIVRPDGTVRAIEAFGRVTTDADGEATGTIGVVRDVTEEKQTAGELERAYEQQQLANARSEMLRRLMSEMAKADSIADIERVLAGRLAEIATLLRRRVVLKMPSSLVALTDGRDFLDAPADLDDADLVLLDDLAAQAALAATRAHHQTRTAEIAEHLQTSLSASPLPSVPGVDLAVHYAPGGDELEHVGGDWYDAIDTPSGALAVVVGDVMGRGVHAATTMIRVRAGIRALISVDPDPAAVLCAADRLVRRDAGDQFVTAIAVLLDPVSRTLRMCNAGHIPVVVAQPGGGVDVQGAGAGVPLGLLDDLDREVTELSLEPGSTVVLVTDGVVESREHDLEEGIGLLARRVGELRAAPLHDLVAEAAALADASLRDDVTVVAARLG